MPKLPDRNVLRAAYDVVVREIEDARNSTMLTNAFYAEIGAVTFDACYAALEDFCEAEAGRKRGRKRVHVVSASTGSGKTTFSLAFIVALTRYAEASGEPPYGCVFLAEQITNADKTYRDLKLMLPGKVAIWTSDHDADRNQTQQPPKVDVDDEDRFGASELQHYPVVVVTHKFYCDKRGYKAKGIRRNGMYGHRALTVIDEQIAQVPTYEVQASQAMSVYEFARDNPKHATAAHHLSALVGFMADRSTREKAPDLEKSNDDADAWGVVETLGWFDEPEGRNYSRSYSLHCPHMDSVFGFARALSNNCAFIHRTGGGKGLTYFMGYKSDLQRAPGMVLLDATADIDGVSQLCPWRTMHDVPTARYDNLSIVHVPSVTKERLSTFLKTLTNRRAYRAHMDEVIREHMKPGERGLVVCKKALVLNEQVPKPSGKFDWSFEGRFLATTHWGAGIGDNAWRDADVVFLFDEFHIPKRHAIATTQGLQGHEATEGALGAMTTQNTRSPAVDVISDGHLLRWSRQMATRGKARFLDENGVCGHQKLVCTGNVDRLVTSMDRLFPGAKVAITEGETQAQKLYEVLSRADLPSSLSTGWVGAQFGRPWREISKSVMVREDVQQALRGLKWRYAPKRGRGGGTFERLSQETLAAA